MFEPCYHLEFNTWEGDLDNYATIFLKNLSVEDLKFYIKIIEKFGTRWKGSEQIGGKEVTMKEMSDALSDAIAFVKPTNPKILENIKGFLNEESNDDYDKLEWFYMLFPFLNPLSEFYISEMQYYNRVCEQNYKVYRTETPLEDVTNTFKSKEV